MAGIAVMLAVFATLLTQSVKMQSQTADESIHLFAGYQYWKHRDFGVNPEHPPLAKLVAAAPLLGLPLKDQPLATGDVKMSQLLPSIEFVNLNSVPQDVLIGKGRSAMAIFAVLLFLLVAAAAKEVWQSWWAAAAAVFLLAFEPNLLAHGSLITTDTAASAMIFATVYAYYRFLRDPSLVRLVVVGIAAGGALAVKHNGAIVFPVLLLLGLRYQRVMIRQALVAIPTIALAVLWCAYGFHSGRPEGFGFTPGVEEVLWDVKSPGARLIISTLRALHIVPESYLWGMADVAKAVANGRQTFLFGEMYREGVWYFFPAVFLMKATIPMLVVLAFLIASRAWAGKEQPMISPWIFFGGPAVLYFVVSLGSGMNLGIRHLLPIFPFLIVLAAEGLRRIFAKSRVAAVALLAWHAATAIQAYPNFIPYSNEAVGGVPNTYRYMADSNADWGQGLVQTSAYLREHNITGNCWIAYWLAQVDPQREFGIPCRPLQSGPGPKYLHVHTPPHPTKIEGTVLISASDAAGMVMYARDRNPYRAFLEAKPDAVIGGAMLVFHGSFDVTLAAAWNHAGRVSTLTAEGKPTEALAEAREAMRIAPDAWDIRRNLCWTMKNLGYAEEETRVYCQQP